MWSAVSILMRGVIDYAHHWSAVSLTPLTSKSTISKLNFSVNTNLYLKAFKGIVSRDFVVFLVSLDRSEVPEVSC
jgi:hypothetical protein